MKSCSGEETNLLLSLISRVWLLGFNIRKTGIRIIFIKIRTGIIIRVFITSFTRLFYLHFIINNVLCALYLYPRCLQMLQLDVLHNISLLFESLRTMHTGERLRVGMNQHVSLQFKFCAQFLVTNLAGNRTQIYLVSQLLVLFESLQCGVGLVTGLLRTLVGQLSIMHWKVIPEIVLVVKLLSTCWTKVFVSSLFVNISQVFQ